jgi:hypothetical protein
VYAGSLVELLNKSGIAAAGIDMQGSFAHPSLGKLGRVTPTNHVKNKGLKVRRHAPERWNVQVAGTLKACAAMWTGTRTTSMRFWLSQGLILTPCHLRLACLATAKFPPCVGESQQHCAILITVRKKRQSGGKIAPSCCQWQRKGISFPLSLRLCALVFQVLGGTGRLQRDAHLRGGSLSRGLHSGGLVQTNGEFSALPHSPVPMYLSSVPRQVQEKFDSRHTSLGTAELLIMKRLLLAMSTRRGSP